MHNILVLCKVAFHQIDSKPSTAAPMTTEDPLLHSPPNLSLDEDTRTTRIMDSLISQLTQLHPSLSIHSSLIQRRLQPFFHSFHTPTHPPYALMIRRAIMELNEGSGSTKEAISEFIKREYDDLPWAHVKILGIHLGKLCEVGELVCAEGGRYVLLPDGEETKQCRVNKKGKRSRRRSKHGDGNGERKVAGESCEGVETLSQEEGIKEHIQVSELDVANSGPSGVVERAQEQGEQVHNLSIGRDEESEKGGPEVIGEQTQHAETEVMAQSESEESQIQDSMPHLETIGSSQLTTLSRPIGSQQPLLVPISEGLPKCLPAAGIGLSPAPLHLQVSCLGHSESNSNMTAKVSCSLLSSSNVQEHKQDENPMSVDPEHQHPNHQYRGRRPHNCKEVAAYQRESLLPLGSLSPAQLPLQMSCHRHSESNLDVTTKVSGSLLSSNVQEHKQDENPMSVDPEHQHPNHQHRGRRPCKFKEVSDYQRESFLPSCSLSPAQLPLQMSCHRHSECKLDATAKVSGSLSLNVQDQEQDENPMFVDPEHQHPIHQCRGSRPRKCKKIANYREESLSPSDSLSSAELHLQMLSHGHSESSLDAEARMSGSLSVNVQEHKQDENPMSEDPEHWHPSHQCRESMPRKCKKAADHQAESLLPSGDATVIEQKPKVKKIDNWWLSQSQGQGKDLGRCPKLHKSGHHINKKIQPQDQHEDLVFSPYSSQKETSYSSQLPAPYLPVDLTHNLGQQLVVPTIEGSPGRIISTGIRLSSTQSQLQISSDIDLGIVSKRKDSLTCVNVHNEQPQHFNQETPIRNTDENPMSQGSGQKPPKRPRGRPPKLENGVKCSGESLFPLDDDIHNKQKSNINKIEQQQYSWGTEWGRSGQVRGRGRPPKLIQNQNAEQCGEQLQQEHQAKQHDQGRCRSRGRPPKPNGNTMQCEEQSQQENQAQQHGRGRSRGRPPKLSQNTNKCEAQLQQKIQAQQQHVLGRGRGRPPKLNQNTNQCERQLQPRDQGLVNSPNAFGNDNQSLKQKQLNVQSFGEQHKSKSGEVKPPAGLRWGSESRCGSGDAYQEPPTATATSVWNLR